MNYIDQADYKQMLSKLGKGAPKYILKESEDIENHGKYKSKSYDLDGDGVPNGADKAPTDGSKQEEGIYMDKVTGPTLENKRDYTRLSVDERKQLEEYINSIKEIKKAINELVSKATVVEGGDNTELVLPDPDGPLTSDDQDNARVADYDDEEAMRIDHERNIN